MHGQHAFRRQDKVEHCENRFLHLAGVLCSGDQDEAFLEVDDDRHIRARLVGARVGMEIRHAQNSKAWTLGTQIALVRAQEELAREEVVPGQFGDDLDWHAIVGVCPGCGIQHVDIAPL